jgi:hypothetical protein
VRFHSFGLIAARGALAVVAAAGGTAGCGATAGNVSAPPVEAAAAAPHGRADDLAPRGAELCGARPRCSVLRREQAPAAAELIVLRLAHAPDASSDEERCDGREYWISRADRTALLARDCEVQWGADNPGPAALHLEPDRASLEYVEFQSSDTCEISHATILLPSLVVERQDRWTGKAHEGRCERVSRDASAPVGDGSLDHPLVVLHP